MWAAKLPRFAERVCAMFPRHLDGASPYQDAAHLRRTFYAAAQCTLADIRTARTETPASRVAAALAATAAVFRRDWPALRTAIAACPEIGSFFDHRGARPGLRDGAGWDEWVRSTLAHASSARLRGAVAAKAPPTHTSEPSH